MADDFKLETIVDETDWQKLIHLLHHGTIIGARRRRELLKDLLDELGTFATNVAHTEAPVGETAYIQRHIGETGISYEPGGAGGGGSYSKTVGVRAGSSMHPLYVHRGTMSIYGSMSAGAQQLLSRGDELGLRGMPMIGRNRIYPRGDRAAASVVETRRKRVTGKNFIEHVQGRRPALTFQKRGEPRKFRAWVSGQAPNPYITRTFVHTAIYAKGRLRAIAIGIIHL